MTSFMLKIKITCPLTCTSARRTISIPGTTYYSDNADLVNRQSLSKVRQSISKLTLPYLTLPANEDMLWLLATLTVISTISDDSVLRVLLTIKLDKTFCPWSCSTC